MFFVSSQTLQFCAMTPPGSRCSELGRQRSLCQDSSGVYSKHVCNGCKAHRQCPANFGRHVKYIYKRLRMRVLLIREDIHRTRPPEKYLAGLIGAQCVAHRAADYGKTRSAGCVAAGAKQNANSWLQYLVPVSLQRRTSLK